MGAWLPHGLVMSEEAVAGDSYRPGFGIYVGQLFSQDPGLPIRVVAHDRERAAAVSQAFGIPLDQIETPQQQESYEGALLRVAEGYQRDRGNAMLVHTHSLGWAIPTLLIPVETKAWLLRLRAFLRLLGVFLPAKGLGVGFYTAAQASRALAEMV